VIKTKEIERFIQLVTNEEIGYHEERKKEFTRLGKKILKEIASLLRLEKGTYDLSYNPGGIAVSGDITLHTDQLYVNFSQSGVPHAFMYRGCDGRKDYGSRNHSNRWMPWDKLLELDQVASTFQFLAEQAKLSGKS
jgi:hypothetical protein